jgi:hypothetical protein
LRASSAGLYLGGFFNEASEHSKQVADLRWSGTRERPDLIVFRMNRGVAAVIKA